MRRRFGGLVPVVALVVVAAPASATEPPLGPVPVNPGYDDIRFRGADDASVRGHWQIGLARRLAIRERMRRKGWNYVMPPRMPRRYYDLTVNPDARLFGLLDLDEAAAYGYHGPPPDPEIAAALRRLLRFEQPEASERMTRAEFRCARSTREWLGESAYWRVFDVWQSIRYGPTDQDSRAIAAEAAWSDCMTAAAYDYDNWWDANDDNRWAGNRATDLEKAVAVADVTCRIQTNLTGILYAVEVA